MKNYTLTADEHGNAIAHRIDCPVARALAAAGEPVVTLFQCQQPLPEHLKRHSCLENGDGR